MKSGGRSGNFALIVLAAVLIPASVIAADQPQAPPSAAQTGAAPAGVPKQWDDQLPLPPDAKLTKEYPVAGVLHSAEFLVPGSFDGLVKFYEEQLPKHGYQLGPKVKNAARKVYNVNFTSKGRLDSVSIYPTADPGKFTVKVSYELK